MLNNYLYCIFIFFLIVLVQINVAVPRIPMSRGDKSDQISSEDTVLPDDFMRFLKSLGPSKNEITTRYMKTSGKQKDDNDEVKTTRLTTTAKKAISEKAMILNNQKAAFKDVLMLKLISYYEDKYRITRHDTPMQPISEIEEISTYHFNEPRSNEIMYNSRRQAEHISQRRITTPKEQAIAEVDVI